MLPSNIHRNPPLRVSSIQQVFALSPARYWRRSIQWHKLHRLSGGVPAGSQDGGHHPYWRNRRQRRGECSRVSQTAQLCKKITHWTAIILLHIPCDMSAPAHHLCRYICSYKKKKSFLSDLALSHALSNLSAAVNTRNYHKFRTKWNFMEVSFW